MRELQEEEPNLLGELINIFLEGTPSRLEALREAFESKDARFVERIAHPLKGSCSYMGAWRMAQILQRLQCVEASADLAWAPLAGAPTKFLDSLEVEFRPVSEAPHVELETDDSESRRGRC